MRQSVSGRARRLCPPSRPSSRPGGQALARSRMVFWRAIVASIIVAIPVGVAQVVLTLLVRALFGRDVDLTVPTSLIAALFGAPFAYLLTGIVLGDVNAREATRR